MSLYLHVFSFSMFPTKEFLLTVRSHRPDPAVARAAFFARSCWSWTLGTPWCAWRPSKRSWRRRSGGLGRSRKMSKMSKVRTETGRTWGWSRWYLVKRTMRWADGMTWFGCIFADDFLPNDFGILRVETSKLGGFGSLDWLEICPVVADGFPAVSTKMDEKLS